MGLVQSGGIIGGIRKQPVWPQNCLYSGSINSKGFIGPIFGGLVQTDPSGSNTNNFSTWWNGNQAGNLTMTSYYTNFSANGTTYTDTETSGTSYSYNGSISQYDMYSYSVEGVNKGIYTNNISSLDTTLNSSNLEVVWIYKDGDLRLVPRLTTSVTQTQVNHYEAQIDDSYNIGTYNYRWYNNGVLDETNTTNKYDCAPNFEEDQEILLITDDGAYYNTLSFTVRKLYIEIEFDINKNTDTVVAKLTGTALPYVNVDTDYEYQWYEEDISGEGGAIEGATSLTLTNLQEGMDYRLVATNKNMESLSAENSFTYGDRIVIYVSYSNGNDYYNDGYTPQTPVRTMTTAYQKLSATGTRNTNVIVVMGTYSTQDVFYGTKDSTNSTYQKNVTITGMYKGTDYDGVLYMYYSSGGWNGTSYNFINGDTTFQYLTFYGNRGQAYLYAQGHNLTMGKEITMSNYSTANTNQGLISGSAPAFHVLGGYLQYNRSTLPRNNNTILIKSGAYGRVLGGGGSGTSSGTGQTTSHDFTGSNLTNDCYTTTITVDIQESTKGSYTFDINLLVGGSTAGNMNANITINMKNGIVGRMLGGSIGDRTNMRNWYYPENTFLGYTTLNLTGGTVRELYGGSLGRNMDAIGSNSSGAGSLTCDIYFYGTITINISDNVAINSNIYGAGAGGVTGYNENSSDQYKDYGKNIDTSVNINITGGTINGSIYGGGYGYTEYLTENVTAVDGGALYGTSNINISGSPTIDGNIYGAGCGYNYSSKTEIAQMVGNTNITIDGTPTINGQIFGAGAGVSGRETMAKLTGNSNVDLLADLSTEVYGGGNIAKTEGNTTINIKNGTHTASIYGGGNLGEVEGNSYVNITGGTQASVFGGGNQADLTNSNIEVTGGETTNVYAGGNSASVTTTNTIIKGGTVGTLYGGSNQTGTVETSKIETTGGTIDTIYGGNNIGGTTNDATVTINGATITSAIYGGGNQVDTTKATVTFNNADNTVPNIFGGGNQAGVPETYVTCNGGAATNVFGGSNSNGTVNTSNVEINNGTFQNVYGGNNQGGTTEITNVNINGGNLQNVYGGGDQAESDESNVKTYGGTMYNIYGGGNRASVVTTNVETSGGNISNVFGGSNQSGTVTTSNVTTNDAQSADQSQQKGLLTMTVDTTIKEGQWPATTAYPTAIIVNVKFTNNSSNDIETWNASIFAPNTILGYNYSQSDIGENNGVYLLTQKNRYYGTNVLKAGGSYNIEFALLSKQSPSAISIGYSLSGTDTAGTTLNDTEALIQNVYGGNNNGGTTQTSNVTINGGGVYNVYGGGNQATTNETNLQINGKVKNNAYGGGNQAGVNTNTNVKLENAEIGKNVYGGGNQGTVTKDTYVYVKDSNIGDSLYSGGNRKISNSCRKHKPMDAWN